MKKAKLFLTGAAIAIVAVGAVAAKSARGNGNLYFCSGTSCLQSSIYSDLTGTTTTQPTSNYFTAIGTGVCTSQTVGCNSTHPSVVLNAGE